MSHIASVPAGQRTPQEHKKTSRFAEFGCTFCHTTAAGKMAMTGVGKMRLGEPASGVCRHREDVSRSALTVVWRLSLSIELTSDARRSPSARAVWNSNRRDGDNSMR